MSAVAAPSSGPVAGAATIAHPEQANHSPEVFPSEKDHNAAATQAHDGSTSETGDKIPQHYQAGVQRIEAAATVWSKWEMISAYACIWLIYFVTSTEEVVVRTLNPFVTSAFQYHSLTATTGVMASIFGGLSKLPLAKVLDTWGRPQGLALSCFLWTIGFIMMASCKNVETYAAAQVFSVVGSQAVSWCMTVFIADTTSLRNRGLMLAFATSPYIVTTWIGGPMANAILAGPGWRWGFGIFAIITPIVVAPLVFVLWWNQHKALKAGLVQPRNTKVTLASIKKYAIEVDLIGILLLAGGMALFLLPFNIWSYQPKQWRAPIIIAFIIVGFFLIVAFVLYEKFLAPVTFIPVHLLADRSVFFAGLMLTFLFFNSMVWGQYFTSMLMVVWNQSVTTTTYISNIYRVGSCFTALVIGVAIRWSGRFKWVATYYGMPLMILGVGLLIKFTTPADSIGLVIMTQIFTAFAGGPLVVAAELSMMAPSDHQHLAVILAILDLFGSVGTAIGSTVAAGIWTGTFKKALYRNLPASAPIERIFASLFIQLAYPVGSPNRTGIVKAYGESQKYLVITSVCALVVGWACAFVWRDVRLKNLKQNNGNII